MEIDYKVCYFSEDLVIHGGSASFCGEFGGEEELARACFLDFDILPFRSSVISKTHGCYSNLKQIITNRSTYHNHTPLQTQYCSNQPYDKLA